MKNFEIKKFEIEQPEENIESVLNVNELQQQLLWTMLEGYQSVYKNKAKLLEQKFGKVPDDAELADFANYIKAERRSVPTGRDLEEVLKAFNMDEKTLDYFIKGKTVLNFGSGRSTLYEEIENGAESSTKIYNLDFDSAALNEAPSGGNKVQADGTKSLPFRSGEFDTVISAYSLPYWSNSPTEVLKSFKNQVDMLKVGGYILLTPINMATRAHVAPDYKQSENLENDVEQDARVNYIAFKNAILMIDLLIKSQESGRLKIFLRPDRQLPNIPMTAIIKKIK